MSSESRHFQADPVQIGGVERALVSGEDIQRRVQAMIDEDPELASCDKRVLAPMPKPTATESPTGCNWTMHYLGQFPGCEPAIDRIVALVQNEVNIGRPTRP